MTRAFTPSPASTPTRTPAGHTAAAPTHGTKAQSSCRGEFHSPFETVNIDLMAEDERSVPEKVLHWLSLVCAGVVIAGIATLLIYNLFALGFVLSPECEYGLSGCHTLSNPPAEASK